MLLEVHTDDGEKYVVDVENYDAEETNRQLNDIGRATIVLGASIFFRKSITRIVPVEEQNDE